MAGLGLQLSVAVIIIPKSMPTRGVAGRGGFQPRPYNIVEVFSVIIFETNIEGAGSPKRGKVRDIYNAGDDLLIVATDRISAFDVILPSGIPEKGKVLTQISAFWFKRMEDIIPNHLISTKVSDLPYIFHSHRETLEGRIMLVKKAFPLPIECIVRGYITGSGWKDYRKTGSVCGIPLPENLRESDRLDEPIFTPSTKAEEGHDENIDFNEAVRLVGMDIAQKVRDISISIYLRARQYAESKGILIADTKFEFGMLDGELILIDEVLTPDSSRFWPKDEYEPGRPQKSYDKQFVRDFLETLDWNKTPPGPVLPEEIIERTSQKYRSALKQLVGAEIDSF